MIGVTILTFETTVGILSLIKEEGHPQILLGPSLFRMLKKKKTQCRVEWWRGTNCVWCGFVGYTVCLNAGTLGGYCSVYG